VSDSYVSIGSTGRRSPPHHRHVVGDATSSVGAILRFDGASFSLAGFNSITFAPLRFASATRPVIRL